MRFTPYPYQKTAVEHAATFLASASAGQRQLYAAPTGCGKSVVELLLQAQFPDAWIVTPREEIIAGMLDKLGDPEGDMLKHRICTPIRLRNMLLKGELQHPGRLIFDESHHQTEDTKNCLDLLTGFAPAVGYTATPYRGSPRSTRDFLQFWGEPIWLISPQEAADEGYIKIPSFFVLPLVDDDIVDVKGGDFEITSIDSATVDRLGDMAEHSRQWYKGTWDKPTIYALPSSTCCVRLMQELLKRGLPAATVNAQTPKADRKAIFEAVSQRILALLHINIVTEGVDLPLRRLVDLAPTLSPVKWVQQLGRIERPTDEQPEYIGTNRNIMRHAYVLEGAVPTAAIADSERAFGPTVKAHARVLGLEAIGRFKPASVRTLSGVNVYTYALTTVVESVVIEYCVLVHPAMEPVWATKINTVVDGKKSWGSWRACEAPTDIRGFHSIGPKELTEKQTAWWKRSAARYGLDPDQEVTKKTFQALPVLADLGARVA